MSSTYTKALEYQDHTQDLLSWPWKRHNCDIVLALRSRKHGGKCARGPRRRANRTASHDLVTHYGIWLWYNGFQARSLFVSRNVVENTTCTVNPFRPGALLSMCHIEILIGRLMVSEARFGAAISHDEYTAMTEGVRTNWILKFLWQCQSEMAGDRGSLNGQYNQRCKLLWKRLRHGQRKGPYPTFLSRILLW